MIILDFETNTMTPEDVIEVAAIFVQLEDGEFKVKDMFHRYYLSRYALNPYSYEVHRLTPELIKAHRAKAKATYPSYFNEDEEFIEFCKQGKTLIAHNINFELRHSQRLLRFERHFCTMKENKNIVKAINKNGNLKNPKLDETCEFYGIDFDKNKHHSATYDVTKTYEIINAMRKKNYL